MTKQKTLKKPTYFVLKDHLLHIAVVSHSDSGIMRVIKDQSTKHTKFCSHHKSLVNACIQPIPILFRSALQCIQSGKELVLGPEIEKGQFF